MHELSIVLDLHDQLAALAMRHRATRVHVVQLDVGALSNVVPDLLRYAFEAVQQTDPLLQGAALEIREIPLAVACRDCMAESQLDACKLQCPRCASTQVRLVKGEELILREVELEVADSAGGEATRPLQAHPPATARAEETRHD